MSHRLTRRTWAALGILLVAIPALMAVFVCVWDERKYYLTSLPVSYTHLTLPTIA